jgi:hypothetical protein
VPGRSSATLAATRHAVPLPTDNAFILRAERELGASLPLDFRSHLLRCNGGEVEADGDDWTIFPVFDDSDKRSAARSASHIVRENAQARLWAGFPSRAVAFATNGSGDYLVFLPGDGPSSCIHRWNHETRTSVLVAQAFASLEVVASGS